MVLGHLGFDFEDEDDPTSDTATTALSQSTSTTGERRGGRIHGRSASQYLSWGGTSQMSFEEQPLEFQESLRQIPMRWRSGLSNIMNSMASNVSLSGEGRSAGGGDEAGGGSQAASESLGLQEGSGGGMGPRPEDGGRGAKGKVKGRLEQQASLEMLRSVMQEGISYENDPSDPAEPRSQRVGEKRLSGGAQEPEAATTMAMGSMGRQRPEEAMSSKIDMLNTTSDVLPSQVPLTSGSALTPVSSTVVGGGMGSDISLDPSSAGGDGVGGGLVYEGEVHIPSSQKQSLASSYAE
ncbi:unnamed protein product [Choristocarpus tenellus]